MIFKSLTNKFLTVNSNVVLTPHIDPVIFLLDQEFEAAGVRSRVTSGLRYPESQLRIIRTALINNRLAADFQDAFSDLHGKINWDNKLVYNWQPGWSKLLNIGFIVNPPLPAECLMDYYRPGSSENRKGKIIQPSPHFNGGSFDIGGGADGITQEADIIKASIGKVQGLKGYLLERNQNCVHCDCHLIS